MVKRLISAIEPKFNINDWNWRLWLGCWLDRFQEDRTRGGAAYYTCQSHAEISLRDVCGFVNRIVGVQLQDLSVDFVHVIQLKLPV